MCEQPLNPRLRILLFEFVTDGWNAVYAAPPPPSLAREGQAMRDALKVDLISAGHRVFECNGQAPDEFLAREAPRADWSIVVAPEFDGLLLRYCRRASAAGGYLLACRDEMIGLMSDKHAMCEHLAANGVPTTCGKLVGDAAPDQPAIRLPAIVKPCDGAGSQDLRRIDSWDQLAAATNDGRRWRVEELLQGVAASVSFLCGPQGFHPLPPCRQTLTADFAYLGGEFIASRTLQKRAFRLAARAVATLDRPRGWIGVDLVLGVSSDQDRVVELNPRLTTSYVGLRTIAEGNLADWMLRIAGGDRPLLGFRPEAPRFAADGKMILDPV